MRSPSVLARRWPAAVLLIAFMGGCTDRDPATAPDLADPDFARAAGIVVNSPLDDGDGTCTRTKCTLRDAIAVSPSGGTVTFASTLTGTIVLTQGPLYVEKQLTIAGPGAERIMLTPSSPDTTVFAVYSSAPVAISGLTISGASAEYTYGIRTSGSHLSLSRVVLTGNWGGIRNIGGTLSIVGSTVSQNGALGVENRNGTLTIRQSTVESSLWDGVYSDAGTVTVVGSTIRDNGAFGINVSGDSLVVEQSTIADNGRSGIDFDSGTLVVTRSIISGNTSVIGAGIYATGADLRMDGSSVTGNTATEYEGGGLYLDQCTAFIQNSTISGNTAAGDGGGIFSNGNGLTTTLINSTISGNASSISGGGLHHAWGTTRVLFSTVTGNSAPVGGGIMGRNAVAESWGLASHTHLKATIVAGNTDGASMPQADDLGSIGDVGFTSLGYNLIGEAGSSVDLATEFAATGDQTGVNLGSTLGALTSNGGPTETHALLAGSTAINAIPASACTDHESTAVETDQRGASRTSGAECDIGAFELTTTPPFSSSCSYSINANNGQRNVTITWSNATTGVTLISLESDGAVKERRQAPSTSGSWSTNMKSGWPSYGMWGGTARTNASTELVAAGRLCIQSN